MFYLFGFTERISYDFVKRLIFLPFKFNMVSYCVSSISVFHVFQFHSELEFLFFPVIPLDIFHWHLRSALSEWVVDIPLASEQP